MSFGNVVTIYRLEKYKFYQIGLDNRKKHTLKQNTQAVKCYYLGLFLEKVLYLQSTYF